MPESHEAYAAYHAVGERLSTGELSQAELGALIENLPTLDANILQELTQASETLALAAPRQGWALLAVADQAAQRQPGDLFLRALSAWQLGAACNRWGQPKRVVEAITRARSGFEVLGEAAWAAACDWQLNDLSWTRPSFPEAARSLAAGWLYRTPSC